MLNIGDKVYAWDETTKAIDVDNGILVVGTVSKFDDNLIHIRIKKGNRFHTVIEDERYVFHAGTGPIMDAPTMKL